MRVLYPLRYFPTLTETFVYREIDGLIDRGHEVVVASMGERQDGSLQAEPPRAPVLRVPRHPLRGRLRARGAGLSWLARVRGGEEAARLGWLLETLGPIDRVHAHFAGAAAEWGRAVHLELGVPTSVMVHAVDLFRPRATLDEVLGAASVVLTVAEHHRALLRERGIESRLLRCGPDLPTWRMAPPPGGPLVALAVARNVPKKGLDLLLQAWSQLDRPGARLHLISDLADPGLEGVRVHGLMPPAGVREVLAGCNLGVLPCRRAPDGDMDGVPVSLMEALAAGRPVIGTAVSGLPELVDESCGWLLPPERVDLLVEALRKAHDQPAERLRKGYSGPRRLTERGFTLEAQVEGLLRAWGSSP